MLMINKKFYKKNIPAAASIIALAFLTVFTSVIANRSYIGDEKNVYTGARFISGESGELEYNQLATRAAVDPICAAVTNSTAKTVFIPTRTLGEWQSFEGAAGFAPIVDIDTGVCAEDGVCGTANGTNIENNPSTAAERCSKGTYSGIDTVGDSPHPSVSGDTWYTYNWECRGNDALLGSTNATCSANRIIHGECGSANGTTVGSAPSGGSLCDEGTATAVSGPGGSNTYTWSCTGENTGTTDSCSADHQSSGPYTLGPWSSCSASCGSGTQTRTVTCEYDTCTGTSNSSRSCDAGNSTCGWSSWSGYGQCSTSCGNGSRYRTRTCSTGSAGSAHCSGSDTQAQSCSAGSSTCGWGSWGGWGSCSASCGGGTQYRYRSCNVGSAGGTYCAGSSSESRSCNTQACQTPINCSGSWSLISCDAWPSQNCTNAQAEYYVSGNGTERYTITTNAQYGGNACPHANGATRPASCSARRCTSFIAGTLVSTPVGLIDVKDVKVGDTVLGSGGINTVLQLKGHFNKGIVYGFNDSSLFVTAGHPFMTTEGWKAFDEVMAREINPTLEIGKLKLGDVLIRENGEKEVLKSFDYKYMEVEVYNFEVSGSKDYYADGYLVHNK